MTVEEGSCRVTRLGVSLCARDTGSEVGCYALPTHTPERLIAETHLRAVAAGALPNDGRPIEEARVALDGEGGGNGASPALDVGVSVGGARFHRRFQPESVGDDTQALVSRLSRAGTIPAGLYHYTLAEVEPDDAGGGGLRLRPFPRALPALPEISLEDAGLELPQCPHPAIFLPAREAHRLLAQAAATPQVEVGALLLVTPFLIAEPVPHRLGVYVREAAPLAEGTAGDALHVRITPGALAAVPVDETRGLFRGGVAHSHPALSKTGEGVKQGVTLFLSSDDVAFATAFFWQPFQFQVVIDAREEKPERALGVFCWLEGRLVRVCFRILEEEPMAWGEMTT
jgi:hypothetical protein